MPRALVSLCAFKGLLTNQEACEAVAAGLSTIGYEVDLLPVGDGGSGSLAMVRTALGGEIARTDSTGPQGRPCRARALLLKDSLYVETSETCGHTLVPPGQKNALRATSFGLGKQISVLLERFGSRISTIYVGLGDSAISDMGIGMLTGLGVRFFDSQGRRLPADAAHLSLVARWEVPRMELPKIVVLCDVDNPACGPRGSARTFAPQKGANPEQVAEIEKGMEHFAGLIENAFGRAIKSEPRTGSAGALSSALRGFFGAELVAGAKNLLDWVSFDERLKACDLLVTGEGKTDAQTLSGKAPYECLKRAQAHKKRAILISGQLGAGFEEVLKRTGAESAHACGQEPSAFEALRQSAASYLR